MASDEKKMEALQAEHARKKTSAGKNTSISKDLSDWETDPRSAQLICPHCKEKREGQHPKFMWKVAAARGEENPVWTAICDRCDWLEKQTQQQAEKKKRGDNDVCIAPQLFLPEERR